MGSEGSKVYAGAKKLLLALRMNGVQAHNKSAAAAGQHRHHNAYARGGAVLPAAAIDVA